MIQLFKNKSLKKTREIENISLNERTQEKDKKQRGRSMVEMLGVLAIIGVLSIGGIQGYTMAMRKYRANEILNIVQKYAMVLYSSCQQAMEKDPAVYSEWGWIESGAGIDRWNFWICPIIRFSDAGLGALPLGVKSIGKGMSGSDSIETTSSLAGTGGASIKSFSSGDAVVILVEFENQELCETVMGMTEKPKDVIGNNGSQGMIKNDEDRYDYTCGKQSYYGWEGYYLAITTMMN